MTKKRTKSLLLTLAMMVSLCVGLTITASAETTTPAAWDGSMDTSWYYGHEEDTAYTLYDAADLAGFAWLVSGDARWDTVNDVALTIGDDFQGQVTDFYGKTVYLAADIYLNSAIEWRPIGQFITEGMATAGSDTAQYYNLFRGTFDGKGHMIYDLYVNNTGSAVWDQENNGLFSMNVGTIRNVGVEGVVHGYRKSAGIAGCNYGLIEYCYSDCDIEANGGGGNRGTGGIVGTNFGTVRYCRSDSDVYNAYRRAGGIVGYNVVEEITADSDWDEPDALIGNYTGTIQWCLFTGYAESANTGYSGSIAATNEGVVENCYWLDGSSYDDYAWWANGGIKNYDGEFNTAGNLTTDTSVTVLGELTKYGAAYAAKEGETYPVLYWEAGNTAPETVTVTVTQPEEERGTVAVSPSEATIPWGTEIKLTHTVNDGYKYIGYLVDGNLMTDDHLVVTKDIEVSVRIDPIIHSTMTLSDEASHTITVIDANGNKVTSGAQGNVTQDSLVEISAAINAKQVPADPDRKYTGLFTFYQTVGSGDEAVVTVLNNTPAVSIQYTVLGDDVTISAEPATYSKEWEDLADTSWYDPGKTSFTISTPGELAGVTKLVSEGETFLGKTIYLCDDIDLSNPDGSGGKRNWTEIGRTSTNITDFYGPIDGVTSGNFAELKALYGNLYYYDETYNVYKVSGSFDSSVTQWYVRCWFMGTFDGQGHKITNLYIRPLASDYSHHRAALFGYGRGAVVKNVDVYGEIVSDWATAYEAGIMSYGYGVTISNCKSYVNITDNTTSSSYAAGILSYCSATVSYANDVLLYDCENYGTITAANGTHVGGLISYGYGGMTVENCMNYGALSAKSTVGGLVAQRLSGAAGYEMNIRRSGNAGTITSTAAANGVKLGGIVGSVGSKQETSPNNITECFNSGTINGLSGGSIGGIVGYLDSTYTTISNCYNAGTVTTAFAPTSVTAGKNGIGGIIGYNYTASNNVNACSGCYNVGPVASTAESDYLYVGGIIGYDADKAGDPFVRDGYYLDTASAAGVGYAALTTTTTAVTATEMQSADFATTLGDSFLADSAEDPMNGGYPVLLWQVGSDSLYSVTSAASAHGTFAVSASSAVAGTTVRVVPTANFAYLVDTVSYTVGETTTVIEASGGKYTFTMPAADVTVSVTFKADPTPVVDVFGEDLNLAQLLAHTTTASYSDVSGNSYTCTGIKLSDILENYIRMPETCSKFTVTGVSGGAAYAQSFSNDETAEMMLAWSMAGDTTVNYDAIRLIVPGSAKGVWVTEVESITTHAWSTEWSTNETHHWHDCSIEDCTLTDDREKSDYGEHVYDDDADDTCNTCGHTRTVTPAAPSIGNGPDEGVAVPGGTQVTIGSVAITVADPTDGWKLDSTTENVFTVSSTGDIACVVLIEHADGTYTLLTATTTDTTHSFAAKLADTDSIVVAVKGDLDGNGLVDANDYDVLACSLLPTDDRFYETLTGLVAVLSDVTGDGRVDANDYDLIACSLLPTDDRLYGEIEW